MQLYLDMFRRLRAIADAHAASFGSEGFTRFFAMLAEELADEYLAEIEAQLGELAFRRGTLISARLGKGAKGTGYVLRRQPRAELAGPPTRPEQVRLHVLRPGTGRGRACGRCRT